MDEVRNLDGRLPGARAIDGPRRDLREPGGSDEPLAVREPPDVHPHEAGGAASGRLGQGRHQHRTARSFGMRCPREERGDIGDVAATSVTESGTSAARRR
jgi:hypothetical protein